GDVDIVGIASPQARTFTVWQTVGGQRTPSILWDGRLIELYAMFNFGMLAEHPDDRRRFTTFALLSLLAEQALAAGALELAIGYAQQIRTLTSSVNPVWYRELAQDYENPIRDTSLATAVAYAMTRIQECFVILHELAHVRLAADEDLRRDAELEVRM